MKIYLFIAIFSTLCSIVYGQEATILNSINEIVKNKKVDIGIAIHDFSTNKTVTLKGNERFPMQSVFKLPIGIAILQQVDERKLTLTQAVDIPKDKLQLNTWSPIQKKYPNGCSLTMLQLLDYTVAQSDNNGCDILIEMLGGTTPINNYLKRSGLNDINIEVNEFELNSAWKHKYKNWITPNCAIELLKKIHNKELLSVAMHSQLWEIMTNVKTGSFRNKLPNTVIVGNKTGSSGYKDGISIATNDIGIMVFPNGKAIAFAIFITKSHEVADVNYELIADIAKVIFLAYQ